MGGSDCSRGWGSQNSSQHVSEPSSSESEPDPSPEPEQQRPKLEERAPFRPPVGKPKPYSKLRADPRMCATAGAKPPQATTNNTAAATTAAAPAAAPKRLAESAALKTEASEPPTAAPPVAPAEPPPVEMGMLMQPSLAADGWSDPVSTADISYICGAMMCAQLIANRDWDAVKELLLEPAALAEVKSGLESMLGDPTETATITPDPLTYQAISDPEARPTCRGWSYIPVTLEPSEMNEAISMDIHETRDVSIRGHYTLTALEALEGFAHIKDVLVPKTIKFAAFEFGRP